MSKNILTQTKEAIDNYDVKNAAELMGCKEFGNIQYDLVTYTLKKMLDSNSHSKHSALKNIVLKLIHAMKSCITADAIETVLSYKFDVIHIDDRIDILEKLLALPAPLPERVDINSLLSYMKENSTAISLKADIFNLLFNIRSDDIKNKDFIIAACMLNNDLELAKELLDKIIQYQLKHLSEHALSKA